jgi:hypothetical protein
MAIVVTNTNYNGEVLEQLLTLAATGNELVDRGLIHIEPEVSEKFSIPRLKTGKMLRKRVEQPVDGDSKGNFNYSEKELRPVDFMAFTTFNPRSFEKVWRKWQPKGNLVFSELSPEAQNALLSELVKTVKFELGYHFIQGEYAENDDDKLFNGILFRMNDDDETITVGSSSKTMIGKLSRLRKYIPVTMRSNPGLRILMSVTDFDTYDDELTNKTVKGVDYTDISQRKYKGITIEPLANWPDGSIVATICGMDYNTNLWAAVNLQDDMDVIQIDKLTNAGERYFFKMLMKADTNIAFGEEVIMLKEVEASISADPSSLTFTYDGGIQSVEIDATEDYVVSSIPTGFSATVTKTGLKITAAPNTGTDAKNGNLVVSLKETTSKSINIGLSQPATPEA